MGMVEPVLKSNLKTSMQTSSQRIKESTRSRLPNTSYNEDLSKYRNDVIPQAFRTVENFKEVDSEPTQPTDFNDNRIQTVMMHTRTDLLCRPSD